MWHDRGEGIMTKFSDAFVKKVQDYYYAEKKKKRFEADQTFTIDHVVEKFGILPNQAKRILYVRKAKE